jgi:hypothetical protein
MSSGERVFKEGDKIYDLVDVIEEQPGETVSEGVLNEEIVKKIEEIAEKIAREMFPGIAERVIKEEIEKLKKTDEK